MTDPAAPCPGRATVSLQLEYFSVVDTGRARSNNEDTVLVDAPLALAVLADGMGGYQAGEVASELAANTLREEVSRWLGDPAAPRDAADTRRALGQSAQEANRRVFEAAQSRAEWAGMGTTLVVALVHDTALWVGHIGDSRAYRLRGERLEQISRDHSLLQEQIDAGLLTEEEAARSVHRNLVTRAVGVEPEVELEVREHELRAGDVLMLCSDGLSDMLPDVRIAEVMRQTDALDDMGHALVKAANEAGGRDNISVILVRAKGGSPTTGRAWWPFRR
jgi:PPM family protein phosphatase